MEYPSRQFVLYAYNCVHFLSVIDYHVVNSGLLLLLFSVATYCEDNLQCIQQHGSIQPQ